jgi:hypothetical protein
MNRRTPITLTLLIALGGLTAALGESVYWDEHAAAQTDNDQVKRIVLARPQEKTLLLVLQSWATNDLSVKLTWNTQVLGFVPGTRVLNAENENPVPASDNPLNLVLPGPYGTRLIEMR